MPGEKVQMEEFRQFGGVVALRRQGVATAGLLYGE